MRVLAAEQSTTDTLREMVTCGVCLSDPRPSAWDQPTSKPRVLGFIHSAYKRASRACR